MQGDEERRSLFIVYFGGITPTPFFGTPTGFRKSRVRPPVTLADWNFEFFLEPVQMHQLAFLAHAQICAKTSDIEPNRKVF